MITLHREDEIDFSTIGMCVLKDAVSCVVKESLNDEYTLTLEYPTNGANYSKIRIGRIICAKPNPYDEAQPFRINSITKPIKGIVTVEAFHISYDMNGIPCKAIDAKGMNEALSQLQNGSYISHNFKFSTDITTAKSFKTTQPFNMRALLMGDDKESLIGAFKGEIKFDKFSATILSKRGKNRGAQVCYGFNMTDLKHVTYNDRLFNGVFPYYHKETTTNETVTNDSFTKAYIVGSKPYQDGWLSFSKDGSPYHPLDSNPVQIATEGDYFEKVYSWNETYQRYEEKIYNQTVTIIEGVLAPSWIVIDWSKFPVVVCRANAKGYYKSATDTDWGEIKGVGDVIFDSNILTSGISGMASNLIIYYSEVIPSGQESENTEVTEVVDVILDDPIIRITTTDANSMKYDRILSLDLTTEFDEEPSKDKLKAKAEEYISEKLLGTVRHETNVSFIDISTTTDADKYKNFDHIELGDTVKVIYRDLGVDVDLRVISTKFNSILDIYEDIELGEKKDSLANTTIQNGDTISSLTNDVGYADVTTVNRLIAKTVTAEYIQAVDAKLSKAQIDELQVAKISCPGIIEASQFVLDEIIAKLLITENAKIANVLEAGTVKVSGDISVVSGSINISSEDGTTFVVNREGNVKANSVEITGGSFNINDGMFEVTNDGTMYAKNAFIEGEIVATSGTIGDCEIIDGVLNVKAANIEGTLTASQIDATDLKVSAANIEGTLIASQIDATDLYVSAANITGQLTASQIDVTNLQVDAANITGRLTFSKLPTNTASTSDIPSKVSELTNDSGFLNSTGVEAYGYQDASQVTAITENTIKTTSVIAQNLQVSNVLVTDIISSGSATITCSTMIKPGYGIVLSRSASAPGVTNSDNTYFNNQGVRNIVTPGTYGQVATETGFGIFSNADSGVYNSIGTPLCGIKMEHNEQAGQSFSNQSLSISAYGLYTNGLRNSNGSPNNILKYSKQYTNRAEIVLGDLNNTNLTIESKSIIFKNNGPFDTLQNYSIRIPGGDQLQFSYQSGSPGSIYTYSSYVELSGTWKSSASISVSSDRNLKHDIEDLDDRYNTLFDNLKPTRFKYNDGTSNRYHTGLIAQDLVSALIKSDISEKEFAAICSFEDNKSENKVSYYGIRYEELHALEIMQIQKLKEKVKTLEEKLNEINRVSNG